MRCFLDEVMRCFKSWFMCYIYK